MSTEPGSDRSTTSLSLSPEERWTVHHVLLHRIEREGTAADTTEVEPPPIEVFRAFDVLDGGESRFTAAQLDAIRDVLAASHWSTDWEVERPRIERLLERVSRALETTAPGPVR